MGTPSGATWSSVLFGGVRVASGNEQSEARDLASTPVEDAAHSDFQCAVCLGNDGAQATVKACGHKFCERCITRWCGEAAGRASIDPRRSVWGRDDESSASAVRAETRARAKCPLCQADARQLLLSGGAEVRVEFREVLPEEPRPGPRPSSFRGEIERLQALLVRTRDELARDLASSSSLPDDVVCVAFDTMDEIGARLEAHIDALPLLGDPDDLLGELLRLEGLLGRIGNGHFDRIQTEGANVLRGPARWDEAAARPASASGSDCDDLDDTYLEGESTCWGRPAQSCCHVLCMPGHAQQPGPRTRRDDLEDELVSRGVWNGGLGLRRTPGPAPRRGRRRR